MYAIIDIETTGGKYNEESMTEIAIIKYDGHKVVDQFISLVNPEKEIMPFVSQLTGITDKMVKTAPKFFEIAKRIIEITQGCTMIAHNTKFDYRMLRLEFRRLGYDFKADTLDTVDLSKKLIPEMESYSLGKLTTSLGIPITDRHRAYGDALATLKLFELLMTKDSNKQIISQHLVYNKNTKMKFKKIIDQLPNDIGVFYMFDENNQIFYIGKGKSIQNSVSQLLINPTDKGDKIRALVSSIQYEKTGSELISLLKESEEIKKSRPLLNRSKRNEFFEYGLFKARDPKGYMRLFIEKLKGKKQPITTVNDIESGMALIKKLTIKYKLCKLVNKLTDKPAPCPNVKPKLCKGACLGEESTRSYNAKVNKAIKGFSLPKKSFVMIDYGKNKNQKSVVLVKNGVFKGYGYTENFHQLENEVVLSKIITSSQNTRDAKRIINDALKTKNYLEIKSL